MSDASAVALALADLGATTGEGPGDRYYAHIDGEDWPEALAILDTRKKDLTIHRLEPSGEADGMADTFVRFS